MPNIWDLFNLENKVFLIAGGARDLGRDMATALAQAGAHGVITSRDAASAEMAAGELSEDTGRTIHGLALDATAEADVQRVVAETVERCGRIDILINNVGGGGGGARDAAVNLEDRNLEDWERLHRMNVTAPFLLCKYVVPIMRRQKSGSIINIASIAGLVGRDRRVYQDGMSAQPIDYAAVKAGVIGFTRDLAAYVGRVGIRVNAISPGGFERGQPRAFVEAYSDKCILGRMGRDGIDLNGAVVYLAGEAAAYVTGHNLVVDGGFTVWQ